MSTPVSQANISETAGLSQDVIDPEMELHLVVRNEPSKAQTQAKALKPRRKGGSFALWHLALGVLQNRSRHSSFGNSTRGYNREGPAGKGVIT